MKELIFYHALRARIDRSSVSNRYIIYFGVSGAVGSLLGFGEIIGRKSLGASGLSVTLLAMLQPIAAFTSIWWARWIEGRDQRKLLIIVGLFGYLTLATGGWLSHMAHLMLMHFLFFLSAGLVGPSENRVLQVHISSKKTGRLYGVASSARMLIAAVVYAGAGFWLEQGETNYRNLYPIAAIIGMLSTLMLASIKTGHSNEWEKITFKQAVMGPLHEVVALLKRRKDYLRFEMAFMIYGIAFMMTLPVVPLYLVDDLQLGYDQIGLARGMMSQVVMIVSIPLFGLLYDRTTPHRMGMWIFMALSIYPAALAFSSIIDPSWRMVLVYGAFAYFGIAMSGLTVLWTLSSLRFAGGEDAGVYQSVHIAATGVRGVFAPLLGYAIMSIFDKQVALLCSSGVFILAGISMLVMRKIDKKRGQYVSLRV